MTKKSFKLTIKLLIFFIKLIILKSGGGKKMVSETKKRNVWLTYLIITPVIYYLSYTLTPHHHSMLTIEFGLLILMGILVAWFPIKTEQSILFLINGVSVAALVIFGLAGEILVSSISLIALMLKNDIKKDEHYRYPLNLLMFQFLSIASAIAYYVVNGLISDPLSIRISFMAIVAYMIADIVANHLSMYLIESKFYNKETTPIFDDDFRFSMVTSMCIVPLSFVLIYLYQELAINGILIGSLPFITVTIGVNIFSKSKESNSYLKEVNKFSQSLNEKKSIDEVIDTYLKSLLSVFPSDGLSYFSLINTDGAVRKRLYTKENELELVDELFPLSDNSVINKAANNSEILCFNRASEWRTHCSRDIAYMAESALVLPVKNQDQVVGIVLLSHKTKNMYSELIISLINLFHQYFTVALDNAFQYEAMEENAETDYLTGLPNLKGFAKKLEKTMTNDSVETFSIIVLDLDKFKKVNDCYGHQAGNEVLTQVADLLATYTNDDTCIARYGGEEFVILLPHYTKIKAWEYAETLRERLEELPLSIKQSIRSSEEVTISVTASFGLSNYPTDSTDSDVLLTLADRAMYIGSKQKGRNRVTAAREGSREFA